jgi:transcriptional regulator with XRE-family HTH domain
MTAATIADGNLAADWRHRPVPIRSRLLPPMVGACMNLRFLREQKFLSQERLAEMSGLSLRTIQRLEAGHRVSYGSLRALAVTLEINVDSLERELYAMNRSMEDFVEIPKWVRLLDGKRWFGGSGLSRRDVQVIEALCLACAVIVVAMSLMVASNATASVLRACGFVAVGCAYLVSLNIRLGDTYKLWSRVADAPPVRQRTWRTRTAEYVYLFVVGILGTVILYWLVF